MTSTMELTDVVVVGSGFGGAIPAYHLAAGGASVVVLERGARLGAADFDQDMRLGGYTRYLDLIVGDGVSALAGNCVGGSSVVYFAASLRAPSFVFERQRGVGQRQWPTVLSRSTVDPWYDVVEQTLPVTKESWADVSYAGGVFAAACDHAGRTCNPVPLAVDLGRCVSCDWMLNGCRFDAKRSMLLNYLPAAAAYGAQIRPLHEVEAVSPAVTPGYTYRVGYTILDSSGQPAAAGSIEAKIVVLAAGALATPVILQRSAAALGGVPAAVGRHFSTNGDRLSAAVLNESAVRDVLGLQRTATVAYEALPMGRTITSMSYDGLDPAAAEFTRFSLQQTFFAPMASILAQDPQGGPPPTWFGVGKKEMRRRWLSWLIVLAMTEDDNEGVFGPPPERGNYNRIAASVASNTLSYRPSPNTQRGWAAADAELRAIVERDGLGKVRPWSVDFIGPVTVHPLASCRIGDDPATSALTPNHELRGHPGLFVTDGSAVPTSLCVNPSLTIAALAERASVGIVQSGQTHGVAVRYGAPAPDGSTSGRTAVLRIPAVRSVAKPV
jgi:choline dehydrogenase-like flavoprotein